jgi:hypothetical protein
MVQIAHGQSAVMKLTLGARRELIFPRRRQLTYQLVPRMLIRVVVLQYRGPVLTQAIVLVQISIQVTLHQAQQVLVGLAPQLRLLLRAMARVVRHKIVRQLV